MTLVDTDALFDFLADRGTADRVARLLERGEVAIAAVTVYELYAGVTNERHLRERNELVGLVDVVDLSAAIARSAAELYTTLKAAGQLISNEDLLIAATGLRTGYPLLTMNRGHFARVPGLSLA